jgi:hypothetical protein
MRSPSLALGLTFFGATVLGAQTQLSGAGTCGTPDVAQAIAVRDRPNHSFSIAQTKCTWTRPFEIAGIQSKGGTGVQFDEVLDTTARFHGYYLDVMSNGDSAYYRYEGTTALQGGAPQTAGWKWKFVGGSGKLKGLKGKGTCRATWNLSGVNTWECTGSYRLPK